MAVDSAVWRVGSGLWARAQRAIRVAPYLRDLSEVLILDRVRGTATSRARARDVAATVRKARFHAHSRIPRASIQGIVEALSQEPVYAVVLPLTKSLGGVGNIDYYHALAAVVQAVRPRRALEFGTYLGVGTLTIALNARPDCRIVTIDLPDANDPLHGLNPTDIDLVVHSRYRVGEAFAGSASAENIEQIRADSLEWQGDDSLAPLDVVLIDGGHSAPIVRADTANAFRLLGPNGVIVWDDYFYLYPEVVSYLEELADDGRPLVSIENTNMVVYAERLAGVAVTT